MCPVAVGSKTCGPCRPPIVVYWKAPYRSTVSSRHWKNAPYLCQKARHVKKFEQLSDHEIYSAISQVAQLRNGQRSPEVEMQRAGFRV